MDKFRAGDRVIYLSGYRMDGPLNGTVQRVGPGWVEVLRDGSPEGPVARLNVLGCQVKSVT